MTGFYLFSVVHNRMETASSRIRGEWLVKYWKDAEVMKFGKKYSTIIYQKVYEVDHAKLFKGTKVLDVCDPDWLHIKEPFIEMIEEVDAVTCPTENIRNAIQGWTNKPVVIIPDRHDLEYFKEKKIHRGKAKEVVWFGYSHNSSQLKVLKEFLIERDLGISIISDEPILLSEKSDKLKERFTKWNLETVNTEIIKSDIVIMPGSRDPNVRFKSNNKTVHSYLLGMPVANSVEDLDKFLDPVERQKEADKNYKMAREMYDVKLSVREMKNLISNLNKKNRR